MSTVHISGESTTNMKPFYLMEEILAVVTAVGVVVTSQETNLDNLVLAWSLAGSVGAALASIFLWSPETPKERIAMFISNCLIGLIFTPFVMGALEGRLTTNMGNCLAVSAIISLGTYAILKPLGPIVSKLVVTKFEKWFGQKLDETFVIHAKKEENKDG